MLKPKFFDKGLHFECTGCGDCCRTHGEYAYVFLSKIDVDAMAAHLKMTRIDFLNEHCRTDADGTTYLTMLNGACNFLDENGRCRVYSVRPKQCATWPFWTENLKPRAWNGPVSACCEGIGKGRLYSREELLAIAKERDDWYGYE